MTPSSAHRKLPRGVKVPQRGLKIKRTRLACPPPTPLHPRRDGLSRSKKGGKHFSRAVVIRQCPATIAWLRGTVLQTKRGVPCKVQRVRRPHLPCTPLARGCTQLDQMTPLTRRAPRSMLFSLFLDVRCSAWGPPPQLMWIGPQAGSQQAKTLGNIRKWVSDEETCFLGLQYF